MFGAFFEQGLRLVPLNFSGFLFSIIIYCMYSVLYVFCIVVIWPESDYYYECY